MTPGSIVRIPVPVAAGADVVESERKRKYRGGWVFNTDTWTFMAFVTDGRNAFAWGSFETKAEAKAAADAGADELNRVMDGPGCLPPPARSW